MRLSAPRPTTMAVGFVLLLGAGAADAQWALVAKRAIGRVEQMSQQSKDAAGPSYDSAAVMLEAPADNVYAAVVRGVTSANTKGIRITREDASDRIARPRGNRPTPVNHLA